MPAQSEVGQQKVEARDGQALACRRLVLQRIKPQIFAVETRGNLYREVTFAGGRSKHQDPRSKEDPNPKHQNRGASMQGTGEISSGTPFCRINAAFHLATERRPVLRDG